MYYFVSKSLYILKSGGYFGIALYTFFQLVLKQHATIIEAIDVNLLWLIIAVALLEGVHNFLDAIFNKP